jgi:hypothetical protein
LLDSEQPLFFLRHVDHDGYRSIGSLPSPHSILSDVVSGTHYRFQGKCAVCKCPRKHSDDVVVVGAPVGTERSRIGHIGQRTVYEADVVFVVDR